MAAGLTLDLITLVGLIFLAAGTIKGLVGIGLPTAAVGMMSQVIDPRQAIALVVFPSMLSNAWQIYREGEVLATLRRFWRFIACLMGMILVVTLTLTAAVPTEGLILILGLVVVLFAGMSLAFTPPVLPERYDRTAQIGCGLAAGALGGLTAIWAPPMVTYLMARRVDKQTFVRATGLIIFSGTVPLIFGFWHTGLLTGPGAAMSLGMMVPALIGFSLGEYLRRFLDAERFRTAVLIVFLLMGLNLVRRALL